MKPYVLLIEDNPDDETLTLLAFEENNLGNPIQVLRDGAEALEFFEGTARHAGRDTSLMPQLILLDLKLPKKSGLEVLQWLRGRDETRMVPVVVLTTSEQDQDMVSSYRLGANSFVRKPVNFQEFQEAVRQLGVYWLMINKLPWIR